MFCVFIHLAIFGVVLGDFEHICDAETKEEGPSYNGVCGQELIDVKERLCRGEIEHLFTRKRKSTHEIMLRDVFIDKREARTFLTKRVHYDSRQREGRGEMNIVCECCYHACSVWELHQYCDPSRHPRNKKRGIPLDNVAPTRGQRFQRVKRKWRIIKR